MTDQFDQLEKQADVKADRHPAWKPAEHGNILRGHLRGLNYPFVPAADEHRWVMTVEDENGEMFSVWLSSNVLRGLVMDQMPAIDSAIVLKYLGKKPTKNNLREYNDYSFAAAESDMALWVNTRRSSMARSELMANDGGPEPSTGRVGTPPTHFGPDEAPF